MDDPELLKRRLDRERRRPREGERLLETKSRELYDAKEQIERQYDALVKRSAKIELLDSVVRFAQQSAPFEQMMQRFVDTVCDATGWPVGHVYVPSERGDVLVPLHTWHLEHPARFAAFRRITEQTTFAPGAGLPGRVWASGQPLWIDDV